MESACPRCNSPTSVPGRLELSGTDSGWPTYFLPDGLRFFTTGKQVPLANGQQFFACLKCGLTWNELAPEELLEVLKKNGTEQTQVAVKKVKEVQR